MDDYDDLKTIKRTPKARDGDLQEGRPHPALRVYGASYGEAVDIETARGRLAARKKGELGIIKGGIDDNDPSLEIKGVGLPGPYAASRLNNKPHPAPQPPAPDGHSPQSSPPQQATGVPVATLSSGGAPDPAATAAAKAPGSESAESVMVSLLSSPPGSVESMVDPTDDPLYGVEDRTPPHAVPAEDPEKDRLRSALRRASERIASLQAELSRKTPGEEYSSGRVRVEVSTDAMTFNVAAVDCIRGASGVVLLLPTAGDAMTFVPARGARAVLSCHERSSVDDCVFTGVSFPIPAIGVLGLVFQRTEHRPAQRQQTKEPARPAKPPRPEPEEDVSGMSLLDAVSAFDSGR